MAIIQVKVKIQGIRPLMFHTFGTESIPLEKVEKTGVAGNDPEEWKRTFSMTTNRQLYLDPSYVFGMLREAAKYTKKGRGSLQSAISATLQVMEDRLILDRKVPENLEEIPINNLDAPVYVDVRPVRNPQTKGRNVRYRLAISSGWTTEFTISFENSIVSRQQMESICNDAGQLTGLADGRSIGYGRFKILSFEILDNAKKPSA